MKKLLLVLGIYIVSISMQNFAVTTCPANNSIKTNSVINSLINETKKSFFIGVYNNDNELCDGPLPINVGGRIPNNHIGYLQVPLRWAGTSDYGYIYFSEDESDIKKKLTPDDIKNLKSKGFNGFEVSGNKYYAIYPINSKGKPDASGTEYTGAQYTPKGK